LALLLVAYWITREAEKPGTGSEKSVQKSEGTASNTTVPSDKQPVAENYKVTIKMDAANIQLNFAGGGDVIKAPISGEVFVRTAEDTVSMKPAGKDAFGNEVFEGMWVNKKTNKGFDIGRMTKRDVSGGACWRNNEANVCAFPK